MFCLVFCTDGQRNDLLNSFRYFTNPVKLIHIYDKLISYQIKGNGTAILHMKM